LDERPTISPPSRCRGWRPLAQLSGAILIVTHDRYFLDNVTGWILELESRQGIPYEGNYSSWLVQKQKRLEQEGREDAAHQKTARRDRNGSSLAQGAPGQFKGAVPRYEELLNRRSEKQTQTAQITIRLPNGSARSRRVSKTSARALASAC